MRGLLSEKVLEPIFWKAKRMPVPEYYQVFKRQQWDSVEKYKARQRVLLAKLLDYAIANIPYYSNVIDSSRVRSIDVDNCMDALKSFPILSKDDVRNNLKDMHVNGREGFFKNSTGGSTGTPLTVYQDLEYQSHTLAATELFFSWAGRSSGARMVKLWGAERDLIKDSFSFKRKFHEVIGNRIIVNAFNLSAESMRNYISIINSQKPDCIEGYADSLYEICRFIERESIEIHSPNSVVSSAGALHDHMREKVESVLRTSVFDRYGSREAGNVAAECEKHNGLHIFGENSIVEVVDDNGNEVTDGEEGELLITNLRNYSMPLIRYKIGDRAIKSKITQCDCGRPYPLLASITGRSSACFKTKDGGVVSPVFFIHLIGVMCNDGSVGKYQVVQEAIDRLNVRLVFLGQVTLDAWGEKERIIALIQKVMGSDCAVHFSEENDIELTPTGKHLYTVCKI